MTKRCLAANNIVKRCAALCFNVGISNKTHVIVAVRSNSGTTGIDEKSTASDS